MRRIRFTASVEHIGAILGDVFTSLTPFHGEHEDPAVLWRRLYDKMVAITSSNYLWRDKFDDVMAVASAIVIEACPNPQMNGPNRRARVCCYYSAHEGGMVVLFTTPGGVLIKVKAAKKIEGFKVNVEFNRNSTTCASRLTFAIERAIREAN